MRATRGVASRRAVSFVGLVVLLAWIPAINGDFVYDDLKIVERPDLTDLWKLASTPYWLFTSLDRHYRPIPSLSFGLTWSAVGARPEVFRLTNVILHAAVAGLVVIWLARFGWSVPVAAMIALAWGVHPVHVETVASVANRPEIFMAALSVLAWLAAERQQWLLVVGLTALAVLSKESAVALLGLVPLTVLVRPGWPWRRAIAAVGIGLAIATTLRALVLGPVIGPGGYASRNPLVDAGPFERLVGASTVFRLAGQHLLWPVKLAPDYSPSAVPIGTLQDVALVTLGLVALALWAWRRPRVALGAGLLLLPLLPVSSLVVPIGALFADRWLYLPAVGAAMLAGEALGLLRRSWAVGLAVVLLALGILQTWATLPAWRSNAALAVRMVEVTPRNWFAHSFRAGVAAQAGEWHVAEAALLAAWGDAPPAGRAQVAFEAGTFFWSSDRDRALHWFRVANSYPESRLVDGYRAFSRIRQTMGDAAGAAWAEAQARQIEQVLAQPRRGRP